MTNQELDSFRQLVNIMLDPHFVISLLENNKIIMDLFNFNIRLEKDSNNWIGIFHNKISNRQELVRTTRTLTEILGPIIGMLNDNSYRSTIYRNPIRPVLTKGILNKIYKINKSNFNIKGVNCMLNFSKIIDRVFGINPKAFIKALRKAIDNLPTDYQEDEEGNFERLNRLNKDGYRCFYYRHIEDDPAFNNLGWLYGDPDPFYKLEELIYDNLTNKKVTWKENGKSYTGKPVTNTEGTCNIFGLKGYFVEDYTAEDFSFWIKKSDFDKLFKELEKNIDNKFEFSDSKSNFSRIYRRTFAGWGSPSRYGSGESENKVAEKMKDTQEDIILRQDIIKNKKKEDLNKIFQSKKRTINAAKDDNFLNQLKDTFTDGKKYADQIKNLKNQYELDIENAKEEDLQEMAKMQRSLNNSKAFMTALGANMDEPGKSAFNALIEFLSNLRSEKISELANNYDDETEYSDNPLIKEATEAYSELDEDKKKEVEKSAPAPESVKNEVEKKGSEKSSTESKNNKKEITGKIPFVDVEVKSEADLIKLGENLGKACHGDDYSEEIMLDIIENGKKKIGNDLNALAAYLKNVYRGALHQNFSRIYLKVFSEVDPKLKEEVAKILKKTGALGTLKSHNNLDDCSWVIEDDGDAYKISVANQGSFVKQVIKELEKLFPGHKVSRDYDIMETIFWIEKD